VCEKESGEIAHAETDLYYLETPSFEHPGEFRGAIALAHVMTVWRGRWRWNRNEQPTPELGHPSRFIQSRIMIDSPRLDILAR
jgi:hypothetical protein